MDVALVGLISVGIAIWAHGAYRSVTPWDTPWAYTGDGISGAAMVSSLVDDGGFQTEARLGHPFGLELYDFPLGADHLNLGLLAAFGVSGQYGWTLNLFYLSTFATSAITAWVVFRLLGIGRAMAVAVAVIFATLPYHFLRNEGHLLLSAYHAVPIGCFLALRHTDPRPLFGPLERGGRAARAALIVAAAVAIGSAGGYYAVFSAALIGTAGLAAALRWRSPGHLVSAVVTAGLIGTMVLVNTAPSILYERENGANESVAERGLSDSDRWGLRIMDLFRPVSQHRSGLFDDLEREIADEVLVPSEDSGRLGAIGAAGLVILFGHLIAGRWGQHSRVGSGASGQGAPEDNHLLERLGGLATVAIVFGSVAGLSWYLRLVGLREVRAWNRISVFVAFLALAAVAISLERLLQRLGPRRAGPAGAALTAGLIVFAAWDQAPPHIRWDFETVTAQAASDRGFVSDAEQALPDGTGVFQLPIMEFPESGPHHDVAQDDHLRLFLWSEDLAWSYGGMRGREADWQLPLIDTPAPDLIDQILVMDFGALHIDRFGYTDRAEALEAELAGLGLEPTIVSPDRRHVLYDLTALAPADPDSPEVVLGRELLSSPRLDIAYDRFRSLETLDDFTWRWGRDGATIEIENPSAQVRAVEIDLVIQTTGSDTTITEVDGVRREDTLVANGEGYDSRFDLEPGASVTLSFASDEGDVIPLSGDANAAFRIAKPNIQDLTVPTFSNGVLDSGR